MKGKTIRMYRIPGRIEERPTRMQSVMHYLRDGGYEVEEPCLGISHIRKDSKYAGTVNMGKNEIILQQPFARTNRDLAKILESIEFDVDNRIKTNISQAVTSSQR